jgi:predicted DNA-binding transcriptional regulator AlpA
MIANERLLRLAEVAEILCLSPGTVRSLVKMGILPRTEFSKRAHRFRKSDVQLLLDTMTIVGKGMGHPPKPKHPLMADVQPTYPPAPTLNDAVGATGTQTAVSE